MLYIDENGELQKAKYKHVRDWLNKNPDSEVFDVMKQFQCCQRYSYKLLAKWREEQDYEENPEERLLESYKDGFDEAMAMGSLKSYQEGYDAGLTMGSALGALLMDALAANGLSISEIITKITQTVTRTAPTATGTAATTATATSTATKPQDVQGYS